MRSVIVFCFCGAIEERGDYGRDYRVFLYGWSLSHRFLVSFEWYGRYCRGVAVRTELNEAVWILSVCGLLPIGFELGSLACSMAHIGNWVFSHRILWS